MHGKEDLKQQSQIPHGYRPTEDQIRRRAYEIYLARGSRPGSELQDWLTAEAELREGPRIFR
jgi:hypothetical protein